MRRPIHEDVRRLQSVEEARVLPPNRGVIDHVHLLDLAGVVTTGTATRARLHHVVDVPLHSPKTCRTDVLML